MAVSDHQRRLLGEVLLAIQRCKAGGLNTHGIQSAVEGTMGALDGETPRSIREALSTAESSLESIRFCSSEEAQVAEAEPLLQELDDAINTWLSGSKQIPDGDDRFRTPGSRFECEEPVAVAIVAPGAVVDWSNDACIPQNPLWLPESLFAALVERTLLQHVDVYQQTRLDSAQCQQLCDELIAFESACPDPDIYMASSLLRRKAHTVATPSLGETLLIEGP